MDAETLRQKIEDSYNGLYRPDVQTLLALINAALLLPGYREAHRNHLLELRGKFERLDNLFLQPVDPRSPGGIGYDGGPGPGPGE